MTKIISIINFKGGVGKTTTTHCIGSGLTLENKKVLLIDTDPQASLTFTALSETPKLTIKDILVDQKNINDVIIKTKNFDIIPSNLILNLAERQLASKFGTEKLLKKAINKLAVSYDYVIIDCPPSMNLFTVNALYASNHVLIPCETELLALDGLNLLIQTLDGTEEDLDISIKNTLVLPTKLDKRKKVSKEILEHLKENFKTTKTIIRTCSKLNLLGLTKESIYEIDSSSTASEDYKNLVEEIIKWDC
ncbi:MAG: ParA family protein [Cetobacterium sp.]